MNGSVGAGSVVEASITAVVVRADGHVDDQGVVSYWHRNLFRRAMWRVRHRLRWLLASGDLGATVVTNGGQAIVTNRMIGAGTEPKYVGWGTGAGTAAVTDSTLFTEKLVDLATSAGTDHTTGTSSRTTTTFTNDTYTVTASRACTGAGTVTNAGLFDAASGGTLYLKGDFTGIGLAFGDSIAFTFNAKFA